MKLLRHIFLAAALLVSASIGLAQTASSASEAVLLEEIRALRSSLERVESRLTAVEQQLAAVATAPVAAQSTSTEVADNGTFMDRVAAAVKLRDERILFPWMDKALWAGVQEGMTPKEVREILGEPTLEDPSLHRRIDTVYTYRGRSPATGDLMVGKVKFYRNEVVEVEVP